MHSDFKRKAKNTTGTALLTVGMGGLIGGALVVTRANKHNKTHHDDWTGAILGNGLLVIGAAGVGVSIPIFVSAGKTRKKRDQLKMKYLEDSRDNTSLQQTKFLNGSEGQNLLNEN